MSRCLSHFYGIDADALSQTFYLKLTIMRNSSPLPALLNSNFIYRFFWLFLMYMTVTQPVIAQNRALAFDGVDDYVQTAYNVQLDLASFTVEAWIQTSEPAGPVRRIVTK